MQFNLSAISDSMVLSLNSPLPIHSVNHKHRQKESYCMSEIHVYASCVVLL